MISPVARLLITPIVPLLLAGTCLAVDIPADSKVLARRGGAEITEAEVDARMLEIPEQQRAGFIDSAERIDTLLNQMLLVEQMAVEARKLKLDETDEFRLSRELAEQRQLAHAYQQHLFSKAPEFNAAALAQESYAASPDQFVIGDSVDVRHILIKTDCRSPAAAKEMAEKLRARALKGEPVSELARKYSEDDASAAEGGLYEQVARGKMVKAFEDAAFAMRTEGELSGVVETPYGYHVIEMVKYRPGRQASYAEIRERLEAQLLQRHRARYLTNTTDRLLNMPLDANPSGLKALRERYGNTPPELAPDVPAPAQKPRTSGKESGR